MKKLIAVTALGLTLGLSTFSNASERMDLYTNGQSVNKVKGDTKGGEIETSPMSFYLGNHNGRISETLRTVEAGEDEENTLLVLGVRI